VSGGKSVLLDLPPLLLLDVSVAAGVLAKVLLVRVGWVRRCGIIIVVIVRLLVVVGMDSLGEARDRRASPAADAEKA